MALVKYNNNSISAITAASSLPTGAMTLIKEQTASSSSTISFVDGTSDVVLDSTYPIYLFKWISVHPQTDAKHLKVNFTTDGTNFNVTKTTTQFRSQHNEGDGDTSLAYQTGQDLAQSTSDDILSEDCGADNDQANSGFMFLFNPSSTTFVKHFLAVVSHESGTYAWNAYSAGYGNTTSAVDAMQFKMSSGNIDAGSIFLHGLSTS